MNRKVGAITISREGNALETQWSLSGPGGSFNFVATADGTLPLTGADLAKVGVTADQQDAVVEGIWTYTPAQVRRMTIDGAIVRTHDVA